MFRLVLSVCATLALHDTVAAPHNQLDKRCEYGATGDLVGHAIYLNRGSLTPVSARQYNLYEPLMAGCVLNGASARACDLFAPEVDVIVHATEVQIQVRRMGPRLRPVTLEVYLYCDPVSDVIELLRSPAITAV